MITKGMMTSKTPEWETPLELFNDLDNEFHFTLDVCATKENAKCLNYIDKERDGLTWNWNNQSCWMNPPYGREIGKWVKKASEVSGGVVVCLLPSRTDTKWFHDYIYNKAEIRFLKGRLKFTSRDLPSWREDGNFKKSPAPFPSMIVIFKVQSKLRKTDILVLNL